MPSTTKKRQRKTTRRDTPAGDRLQSVAFGKSLPWADPDLDGGEVEHLPDECSALADDVAHQGLGHSDLGELTGKTRELDTSGD